MKIVALLLGPSGTGMIGLYSSILTMVQTVSDFGIKSSAVREIAQANAQGDATLVAHVSRANWRICWLTGILGWLISAALAVPLSNFGFGNSSHSWAIVLLGGTVLVNSLAGGVGAQLQGLRQIGALARMQVLGGVVSTLASIGIYMWLKAHGIIPVLILTAIIHLVVSLYFASETKMVPVMQTWRETVAYLKSFAGLGFGFMWSGLVAAGGELLIRSWIVRDLGLAANGIYQAAWSISAMLVNFVLGAMGTDFYPRLSGAADDPKEMERLVNEQTEIGILLSIPGLIAFLCFSRWIIELFYSSAYFETVALLPWFIIGSYIRVFGWPLGFLILAKKANGWFVYTQSQFQIVQIAITFVLLPYYGAIGAAAAFCLSCFAGVITNVVVTRRLTGFRWSPVVLRLIVINTFLILIMIVLASLLPLLWLTVVGVFATFGVGVLCLRGIVTRVGTDNALVQKFLKVPGLRFFIGNS